MSAKGTRHATRKGQAAPKKAAHAPRAIEIAERGARGYPSVRELLASGKLDALGDVLRAVLSGAVLASAALGGSACGTTAHAGAPAAPIATLAPATPAPATPTPSPKPGEPAQLATLVPLPLPPPPPLPGTEPVVPLVAPPPHHPHIRPPQPHIRLGGAIAAPRPVPVAVGGAEPAIDF